MLEHGFGRFNSVEKRYLTILPRFEIGVFFMRGRKPGTIIASVGDGDIFCSIYTSHGSDLDAVAAAIKLLAKRYPEELAQVCARPYGETTEEWVGMMAEGHCPGIEAGYVPASRSAPEGAERK